MGKVDTMHLKMKAKISTFETYIIGTSFEAFDGNP